MRVVFPDDPFVKRRLRGLVLFVSCKLKTHLHAEVHFGFTPDKNSATLWVAAN